MTLKRHLLASAAITLSGLGIAHAGPFSQMRSLTAPGPAALQYVTQVQLSVADAEASLAAALARQTEAEASGGDIAAAQAVVAQAEQELAAAQSASQAATEAAPEPEPLAPVPAPAAPEPEPETIAPAAEAEPAAPAPAPVEQPTAEDPVPAAEPAPVATPETAVAPESASESAPQPVPEPEPLPAPDTIPAPETPVEAVPQSEATAPPPTSEAEEPVDPAPAGEPTQASEPETNTAPQATTPAEPAPTEENPEAEPVPLDESGAAPAETPAAVAEEVLTLPVEDGAPVLDSAKEEPTANDAGNPAPAVAAPSGPVAPPPTSDADAQATTQEVAPDQALAEPGDRMDAPPAPEAPTNVTIINRTDNRTVIEVDNRMVVINDDRSRLRAGADEVYYEQLRGGRVREVVVRPNGVQLVTITNRWGDVVQRSRIMPDGREYVLFFDQANTDGSRQPYVDPGRDLPPLRLSIPIADYILNATDAKPSAFLNFLLEPPVERVERLYSVDEVRRSARVRDKVRRIDLDSLTFELGKATIVGDQITRLAKVADAMTEILRRNPAETFLIEGHTDAVGSDQSNLILSDQRADTIAVALSTVFGIPPENLVTQGYGERYLKVRTEKAERLNRRVTIRRITALVSPVASR